MQNKFPVICLFYYFCVSLLYELQGVSRRISQDQTSSTDNLELKNKNTKMNLFDISNLTKEKEQSEAILKDGTVVIERLTSFGHPTPEDEWYDQEQCEWVALLEGTATIRFEDGSSIEMVKGDHIIIEPHSVHRVEKVSEDAIWLAVFI